LTEEDTYVIILSNALKFKIFNVYMIIFQKMVKSRTYSMSLIRLKI